MIPIPSHRRLHPFVNLHAQWGTHNLPYWPKGSPRPAPSKVTTPPHPQESTVSLPHLLLLSFNVFRPWPFNVGLALCFLAHLSYSRRTLVTIVTTSGWRKPVLMSDRHHHSLPLLLLQKFPSFLFAQLPPSEMAMDRVGQKEFKRINGGLLWLA